MNPLTMQLCETWRLAGCQRHRGPGILPGVSAWHGLCNLVSGIALSLFAASCSQSAPLISHETTRGKIEYTLHSPETPARHHVILAHGFLRNPQTMDHLAESFANGGIETACIKLKRSTLSNGKHAENARDMIALRQALGWQNVIYAGFSAGGLSALCHQFTGSKWDAARTAKVHEALLRETSLFLKNQPGIKP